MEWLPATKQEVLAAIEKDWVGIDPATIARLSSHLVDPRTALIERSGQWEPVFVVAQMGRHVVFFEDVEEYFGTAEEVGGKLSNVAIYSHIALALRGFERQA